MFAFNRKAYVAQINREAELHKVIHVPLPPSTSIDGSNFSDSKKKTLKLMGMNGKGSLSQMEKDTLYNPNKAKKEL